MHAQRTRATTTWLAALSQNVQKLVGAPSSTRYKLLTFLAQLGVFPQEVKVWFCRQIPLGQDLADDKHVTAIAKVMTLSERLIIRL